MKILLVSTDLMASSQLEGASRSAGATLAVVGPAKVDGACDPVPQLVALDLSASIADIAGLVSRLKALEPPPAVVAFGPHVHEQKLEAARSAGCDEVLTRGQMHRSAAELFARYASG